MSPKVETSCTAFQTAIDVLGAIRNLTAAE